MEREGFLPMHATPEEDFFYINQAIEFDLNAFVEEKVNFQWLDNSEVSVLLEGSLGGKKDNPNLPIIRILGKDELMKLLDQLKLCTKNLLEERGRFQVSQEAIDYIKGEFTAQLEQQIFGDGEDDPSGIKRSTLRSIVRSYLDMAQYPNASYEYFLIELRIYAWMAYSQGKDLIFIVV